MTIAEDREDVVLTEFAAFLRNQTLQCDLLENPDKVIDSKKRFPTLTTDGLMAISHSRSSIVSDVATNENLFGVDVMLLALSRENLALHDLVKSLDVVATQFRIQIRLTSDDPIFQSECDQIIDYLSVDIALSPQSGANTYREGVRFTWATTPEGETSTFEIVEAPMHSLSACLSDQIRDENRAALEKKMKPEGQAERCRANGLPYILLLDGIGTVEVVQGTHFLARYPFTYRKGILEALGTNANLVNAIFLVDKNGKWVLLESSLEIFSNLPRE